MVNDPPVAYMAPARGSWPRAIGYGCHHAFLLERMLAHVEDLESDIAALSERIEEQIRPFEPAIALLRTIPGVERRAAEVLVAETGADMSRFPGAWPCLRLPASQPPGTRCWSP